MGTPEQQLADLLNKQTSRRTFLKGILAAGGLGAAAYVGIGCETGPKQLDLDELHPTTDKEAQTLETLKVYTDVKKLTNLDTYNAATLTQAALYAKDRYMAVDDYRFFKDNHGSKEYEAVSLALVVHSTDVSRDQVAEVFEKAKNDPGVNKQQTTNIVSLTSFKGGDLESVKSEYNKFIGSSEPKEIQPVLVASTIIGGNQDRVREALQAAKDKKFDTYEDLSAISYAATFSDAEVIDIVDIALELVDMDISPTASANLTLAAVLNRSNLEEVVEMYNFAGSLRGVSQEAAAKLVLATIAKDIKVPELVSGGPDENRNEKPGGNDGDDDDHVFIYPAWWYYCIYGTHYNANTQSGFRSVRGASFSRPGIAPVRGTGGSYGIRGSGSGGTRGGVGGRGGSGSGGRGGGS